MVRSDRAARLKQAQRQPPHENVRTDDQRIERGDRFTGVQGLAMEKRGISIASAREIPLPTPRQRRLATRQPESIQQRKAITAA
ncbi:MAG: hypothetical protein ACREJO_01690 [Phycisphaerales bacterium]